MFSSFTLFYHLLLEAGLILGLIWRGEYHIPLLFPLIRLACARPVLHELSVQGHCCIEGTKISGLDEPLFFKDITHAHRWQGKNGRGTGTEGVSAERGYQSASQAACYDSEKPSAAGESFSSAKGKPLTPMLIYSCYMIPRDRAWPTERPNSLFRTFRDEKGEGLRSDGRRQGETW